MLFLTNLLIMKTYDIYNYTLSVLGCMWSAENIDNVLGIILMVLSIINILWSTCYKLYDAIKTKKYSDVSKILDDAEEKIKEIEDKKNDN